jgi:hypothetical protein
VESKPRKPSGNTAQQTADAARWPVLARLSDVSTSIPRSIDQASVGATSYRFDPPQAADGQTQSALYRDIQRDSPSSEVQSGGKTLRTHQPHVFDRGRASGRRSSPQRESPILPRSNPFAIPRVGLLDSAAPTIRFLTMVVLFTAAATWVQMVTRHAPPSTDSIELPTTAADVPIAPTKNASDHPLTAPTAAGPLETNPQSGARVGRAKGDDFATRKQSSAVPCPVVSPSVSPPRFLIAGSQALPQVQTTELPVAGNQLPVTLSEQTTAPHSEEQAGTSEAEEAAAVARYPGFSIENPTR